MKIQDLKKELDVVKLEERLEMINLAVTTAERADNGVCCCSGETA